MRCATLEGDALCDALDQLPGLVKDVPSLRVVFIDNLAAYYWLKKAADPSGAYYDKVAHALHRLVTRERLVCVVTKPTLFSSKTPATPEDLYLGKVWQGLPKYRCVVHRTANVCADGAGTQYRVWHGQFAVTSRVPTAQAAFYFSVTDQTGCVELAYKE